MQIDSVHKDAVLLSEAISLPALVDHVGAYFYAKDLAGRYLFANQAVCTLFGASLQQVLGEHDSRFMAADKNPALFANDRRVLEDGEEVHEEEELLLYSGTSRVFWSIKVPIRDQDGCITGLCGISTDITQSRQAADELLERSTMLNTILANVDASVYVKDHEGKYLYANQKVIDLYGRPLAEILGQTDHDLLAPEVANRLMQLDRTVLDSGVRQASEEILASVDGGQHHFWSIKVPLYYPGQPTQLIGFSTDITELLSLKQSLIRQRTTDSLTELANRVQFKAQLKLELSQAERKGEALAVVLFDLDQFKYINNSLGQEVGDQLLREVATRLRQHAGIGSVARLSGDEFVITLPGVQSPADALAVAEDVRAFLGQPYHLRGRPFLVTASAGISLYPGDAGQATTLISHAEAAMYSAKERGRDQSRVYSSELSAAVAERLELERDLRGALAANEFELYYQPKIRATDGSLAGFEALLRWNRSGHPQVAPTRFIPLAEELGLLVQIGKWVIEEACRQIAHWHGLGRSDISVAVNLSPSQLASQGLAGHVSQLLQTYQIPDNSLEMEVTESMMMSDPEQAIAILGALRQSGIQLSIDDFGTGYSSMAYLKRLPVHALKLDRQFVMNVATDSRDVDICAGMIALAHKLGLHVIAEGVETAAQRDVLATLGCDLFQGYFFSRPLPVAAATVFLDQHTTPAV